MKFFLGKYFRKKNRKGPPCDFFAGVKILRPRLKPKIPVGFFRKCSSTPPPPPLLGVLNSPPVQVDLTSLISFFTVILFVCAPRTLGRIDGHLLSNTHHLLPPSYSQNILLAVWLVCGSFTVFAHTVTLKFCERPQLVEIAIDGKAFPLAIGNEHGHGSRPKLKIWGLSEVMSLYAHHHPLPMIDVVDAHPHTWMLDSTRS